MLQGFRDQVIHMHQGWSQEVARLKDHAESVEAELDALRQKHTKLIKVLFCSCFTARVSLVMMHLVCASCASIKLLDMLFQGFLFRQADRLCTAIAVNCIERKCFVLPRRKLQRKKRLRQPLEPSLHR